MRTQITEHDCKRCKITVVAVEIMSRELALDDIVTEFLLDTCRLRPLASKCIEAALLCGQVASKINRVSDDDSELIPLTSGSVAEFYIEPMLPGVGDIDVMVHSSTELAIPRGHPPPTQLPAEFHNYVRVHEIIDSHLPGYVYLELCYLLTECSDNSNCNAAECQRGHYLSKCTFPTHDTTLLRTDQVPCVRCLSWLTQAADWPTRHRNYGWPDSATLDRVVSNGCDVVGVAHRQCRQHEWMNEYQWRLSFSRAEVVLLNSWMPVQQIVYHMLRYFMKTGQLTECDDKEEEEGTLSNYHIKTLILWACELKPRSWWTDDVNLVRICHQLLHILAKWLTDARCKHYFINDCNLIDSSFNLTILTNIGLQLVSIDEAWLSTWFVDNYIRRCSQFTPYHITLLFDDVSTSMKLQNAVSALVNWRLNASLLDMWRTLDKAGFQILSFVNAGFLTTRSCVCLMTELAKIDSRLCIYFTAVAFLHVASRFARYGFHNKLMDILSTVCGQFINTRRYPNHSTRVLSLNTAAKLMKVVANKSLSTMSLIEIELSKAYLYRALRCKDSDSDSIYCLANVYLAVLYYTTGQYQTAIDHCTLVTRSQDHSQCSSHVVQGEILPKIDDDVDNMLGLAELYQHVRTAALKQQRQPQLISIFSTELFACYLHIKYLSPTKCCQFMQMSSTNELKRYGICISDTPQLFIGDVLLFLTTTRLSSRNNKPITYKPQHTLMNANECNPPDLVELLQKFTVEHLKTYRQLVARDFGSVVTIVTTDFEAMYAYKRGDYQRCLQLSTRNLHTLLYAVSMPDVPTFPEFLQLFDDDIASLIALTVIVNPRCRRHCNTITCITQLTLSLYLMTQCQLKLHHSVTSLAQTLGYIEVAQRRLPVDRILDQITLKLIKRKLSAYTCT